MIWIFNAFMLNVNDDSQQPMIIKYKIANEAKKSQPRTKCKKHLRYTHYTNNIKERRKIKIHPMNQLYYKMTNS